MMITFFQSSWKSCLFIRFMKVLYSQVYPRVSKMASLSEPKVQSCEDHRGHGQRKQDDSVQEH